MFSSEQLQEWEQALREGARALDLPLSEAALSRYRRHYELLLAHNARAGLTSLSDPVEIAVKHYLDSLSVLLVAVPQAGEAVADLGPGAGFPGLVVAAACPEASYTLLESSAKRSDFLRLAVRELELPHVAVVTARAEDAGRDAAHRDHYDLVLARALAALPVLLEYGLPLIRLGGRLLALKGPGGRGRGGRLRSRPGDVGGTGGGGAAALASGGIRCARAGARREGLPHPRGLSPPPRDPGQAAVVARRKGGGRRHGSGRTAFHPETHEGGIVQEHATRGWEGMSRLTRHTVRRDMQWTPGRPYNPNARVTKTAIWSRVTAYSGWYLPSLQPPVMLACLMYSMYLKAQ